MKPKILIPAIAGFSVAIILLAFFSQESIAKNIGIEKEHYELSFAGIGTYHEGDLVKIKMLLSGYGTDCASFLMEIRDADGNAVEKNGYIYGCTAPPMKKLDSVEVLTIESRLGEGNYTVFGQFSADPEVYFTKTENFTVAKIDNTALFYPIAPPFDQNKFDAVIEGTVLWCMGHKNLPYWYQCEISVGNYIKFDGQRTEVLTVLGQRSVILQDHENGLFGLDYHSEDNFYEIKESVVIEK